jgi:hypothetical protein
VCRSDFVLDLERFSKISDRFLDRPDIYSQKGGDFMNQTFLIRILVLMVVLKVETPVIINLTIDGTTHHIEII